ncbi:MULTISPECIES: undecaprenyl-diphosphate phosphatase [unclassified Crossiella]|uniref:undecaprenyl-diphosphate phosphatase n=1 Tax=unclassified Crossiella TaxID=2620835 RepID=UPI00207C3985|nr:MULTISPECIES: undecaprenyl-diphosphate phosphatase [unclassified Crossiella]MCO1575257.1 undecaprenyl-diphosphate phosphatase [Crossiella sp. SN42]WHT15614.1 undecaprenyl-diphosphate phosphatase [Crossiella sp. CA-258035]
MTWLEALVLGVVQGLTEMLPISSSGHLRIVSELFFGRDAGASFTAVTQLGTEAAVLIYFAKDIFRLVGTWFRGFASAEVRRTHDYKLAWYVIIGTIPISVLGLLFKDEIRTSGRNLWIVGTTLVVFGLVLGAAELYGRQRRSVEQMTLKDGIIMGCAQAMALVPGVSRSGGTITAGLFIGLDRAAATRYSFLLAIPAVVAAGVFSLPDVFERGGANAPSIAQMIVATAVAFAIGYVTIAWLLKYVAKHSVYVFVWYRVVVGLFVLAMLSSGYMSAT